MFIRSSSDSVLAVSEPSYVLNSKVFMRGGGHNNNKSKNNRIYHDKSKKFVDKDDKSKWNLNFS